MNIIQPREFNPRKTLFVGSIILILIVVALTRDPPAAPTIHWSGETMGTYYDVKIAHASLSQTESRDLLGRIQAFLRQMNNEMSTYIEDSEISRFNQSESTAAFPVSLDFAHVTRAALEWARRSEDAFDPTLDPVINLWGFGHRTEREEWPSDEDIGRALALTGYEYVSVADDGSHIIKDNPRIQLNLDGIAKGYAIDGISRLLMEEGQTNIYVDIGGDVYAHGVNRSHVPWRIGIEMPDPDASPGDRLYGIAHLTNGALAGSGDYRQFKTASDGLTYSHIIDPRTGAPIRHALASVNVWAPNTMSADAAATTLMVMGLEEGLRWVETVPDVESIFFVRRDDADFDVHFSAGFQAVTQFEKR